MFEPDEESCNDPKHYPPTMMYFPRSGKWVCPSCGHVTRISVPTCTMSHKDDDLGFGFTDLDDPIDLGDKECQMSAK